jgi:hypothetical protein
MKTFFLLAAMLTGLVGRSQKTITNFTLADVATGDRVSLSDFSTQSGIAVIFTSNDCPFDSYYRTRISALIDQYKGKIQFLLINSYLEEGEDVDAMKVAYATWKITAPYLADKERVALQALDASKSPEVFLLKRTAAGMTVFYNGSIDDSPQVASGVRQAFLKDAIDQLLRHGPPDPPTRSVGCTIR